MIIKRLNGDITAPSNQSDIIIAMNTELGELSPLGRRFFPNKVPPLLRSLGSVLTFQFDEERQLHMIVCHNLCEHGWRTASKYLRFGLDYLWSNHSERNYSIVRIGCGNVGKKYKADPAELERAMEESFLSLTLYTREEGAHVPSNNTPLSFLTGWNAQEDKHSEDSTQLLVSP